MEGKPKKKELRADRFPYEYIIDLNGQKAAERCGYSPKTARAQASRLLTKRNIQEKIRELQDEQKKKALMGADEVERLLDILCRSNLKDYYDEHGQLKNIKDITDEQAYALKSITSFTREGEGGTAGILGMSVERYNPREALKLKMQRLGMLKQTLVLEDPYLNYLKEIEQGRTAQKKPKE